MFILLLYLSGIIPCFPLFLRLPLRHTFSIVFNLKERKVDFMRHFQVKWNLVWGMACAWLLLVGCTPGAKRKLTMQNQAIGLPFEVVVVQEEASWKSSLGDALLAELESPYPALPQPEAFAKVSHCTPDEFTDFMRSIRNVVWVDVDTNCYTKPTLRIEKDVWANGQQVFRLQAPSASALEQYVHEAGDTLRVLLREEEQRRYATYLEQYHSSQVDRLAQEYLGLSLYVPEELDSYTKDSAFVWASNDAVSGRMDIVLYAFPASGEEDFTATTITSPTCAVRLNCPSLRIIVTSFAPVLSATTSFVCICIIAMPSSYSADAAVSGAFSIMRTTRNLFILLKGRVSVTSTLSPIPHSFFSS